MPVFFVHETHTFLQYGNKYISKHVIATMRATYHQPLAFVFAGGVIFFFWKSILFMFVLKNHFLVRN